MDLHIHPFPVFVRLEKWWISGVFTQGTGFKLRNETDKYGSSYNMLEDGFAGKKLSHEMGLKKDTVVIKNGVSFIITGAFFKWPTLNRWVVVIPSLKLTYPPKMALLKMIFRTSQGGIC